jgi:hypothetical protein
LHGNIKIGNFEIAVYRDVDGMHICKTITKKAAVEDLSLSDIYNHLGNYVVSQTSSLRKQIYFSHRRFVDCDPGDFVLIGAGLRINTKHGLFTAIDDINNLKFQTNIKSVLLMPNEVMEGRIIYKNTVTSLSSCLIQGGAWYNLIGEEKNILDDICPTVVDDQVLIMSKYGCHDNDNLKFYRQPFHLIKLPNIYIKELFSYLLEKTKSLKVVHLIMNQTDYKLCMPTDSSIKQDVVGFATKSFEGKCIESVNYLNHCTIKTVSRIYFNDPRKTFFEFKFINLKKLIIPTTCFQHNKFIFNGHCWDWFELYQLSCDGFTAVCKLGDLTLPVLGRFDIIEDLVIKNKILSRECLALFAYRKYHAGMLKIEDLPTYSAIKTQLNEINSHNEYNAFLAVFYAKGNYPDDKVKLTRTNCKKFVDSYNYFLSIQKHKSLFNYEKLRDDFKYRVILKLKKVEVKKDTAAMVALTKEVLSKVYKAVRLKYKDVPARQIQLSIMAHIKSKGLKYNELIESKMVHTNKLPAAFEDLVNDLWDKIVVNSDTDWKYESTRSCIITKKTALYHNIVNGYDCAYVSRDFKIRYGDIEVIKNDGIDRKYKTVYSNEKIITDRYIPPLIRRLMNDRLVKKRNRKTKMADSVFLNRILKGGDPVKTLTATRNIMNWSAIN